MNPAFILCVLIGAVVLWFCLSSVFIPFGRWLYKYFKDAVDNIAAVDEDDEI